MADATHTHSSTLASASDDEDPLAGIRLIDAPILLFVVFHKAFRGELYELKKLAVEVVEIGGGDEGRRLVNAIFKRFEFLKLAYQYHCAAEDEVIFLALDGRVKNVAYAYSLEHKSIDDLFSSLFNYLSLLVEAEQDVAKSYQELVSRIGTIQTAIFNHMYKEEKQLFPMIVHHFTPEEQSPLVWQFICSVPVGLLEDFFPWVTYFLSPNEKLDVLHCMQVIVPNESLLQKVVISWLGNVNVGGSTDLGQLNHICSGPGIDKSLPKFYYNGSFAGWSKANNTTRTNTKRDPIFLHVWHGAILKDFNEILVELYQARALDSFVSVPSLVTQLKFLADIVIFYRNTLDKLLYPILDGVAKSCSYDITRRLIPISNIESLQRSLYNHVTKGTTVHRLVEKICWEVDSFLKVISKHFTFLEIEVVPMIRKLCSFDTQQSILYASLQMMPLGLLKCTTTWFMAHLSEVELKSILCFIRQGASELNGNFASLLNGWVRGGFSGKSSIETFRKDLNEMFSCRCSYITELAEEIVGSSPLNSVAQHCNKPRPMVAYSKHSGKPNCYASTSSSLRFRISEKHGTLYSSGINMRIFYPRLLTTPRPFPESLSDSDPSAQSHAESRPLDYLLYFHKALKKDLEYLACKASELAESDESLKDFIIRFKLVHCLYQLHSDAEDDIAFPALEAKGKTVENISCSYTIDHKLEADHFNVISELIDAISLLINPSTDSGMSSIESKQSKYRQMCSELHNMCRSMNKALFDHIDREETELWPLFRKYFSTEEKEKIVGYMLGRLNGEVLQQILPWLMASITPEEQKTLIQIWRRATKNTKFSEWLRAWWEGFSEYDDFQSVGEPNMFQASTADALEVVSAYLSEHGLNERVGKHDMPHLWGDQKSICENGKSLNNSMVDKKEKSISASKSIDHSELHIESKHKRGENTVDVLRPHIEPSHILELELSGSDQDKLSTLSQEELEIIIRKISRDASLDSKKKSYMMQNLLMSRWIATQRLQSDEASSREEAVPGQCASYHDPLIPTFGCKHYKRNCKLLATCCNQLYPCIRCHDEEADHSIDRETITQMMCMRCLVIQPIGSTCSTNSCNSFSMGKYYCSICKLFDDGREIYHCPYCNLCRVGKGLGIDFFHCMNCNACMSRLLLKHVCREKCFEDNCPICHEYIFTSSSPIKALPCGHLMHSSCFQDYTCAHYTCPICSKSLGDMQVYFGMLDAMLAEEKIPDEYSDKNQLILCNDCGKRATTPYHWMYHKCPSCGSYNTRLL